MNLRSFLPAALLALQASLLPLSGAAAGENTRTSGQVGGEKAARADYVLQPQDVIRVQVFQEEEINRLGEVRVSQEHSVTLPLIGMVELRGKTVRQAEDLIRALYDRDFLVNPQVNVTVVKYVERVVKVFGSVNSPGVVQFPPEEGLTLSEAISRAGGFSRLADKKRVTLSRTDANGQSENRVINADDLLKAGSGDVALQPDDIINVPERIL